MVDRSTTFAGALAAMYLADFGADVVRVAPGEVPGGRWRARDVLAQRGKRLLTEPLRHAELADLVARADVVVVDGRPGTLEGEGLDAATLAARLA